MSLAQSSFFYICFIVCARGYRILTEATIIKNVQQWMEQVVLGLSLCPFAHKPWREGLVALEVCGSAEPEDVLEFIQAQLCQLEKAEPAELETTLVITPNCFADFIDYNQFLNVLDALLKHNHWRGVFQIASFHPHYQFAGTDPTDHSNLTNRSPYPIFHLLREDSLEQATLHFPNPESIPDRNIEAMQTLTDDEIRRLFPFLSRL